MAKKNVNADQLISTIISGIEDVKGKEINILDLRDIENTVCDYFIICEGTSNTQVNAIVNSIQKKVSKELKDHPWQNIAVHVFQKHIREYYDIEGLWGDAKSTVIQTSY
ncbi:MAG: ribosome silencing factor RsfS [Flavobacteriales bacterium 32-35-8]|nr:MAG: ribosome silencing factor RsfS [Flavobacteriales bacterium 32-35-8]